MDENLHDLLMNRKATKNIFQILLLMEEIQLNTWDVKYHVNNGKNCQPQQ